MNKGYYELTKYRESMYRLLSSIYIEEIDKEGLEKLLNLRLPKIKTPVENWQMDFNSGYEMVEGYLEGFRKKSEEDRQTMLEDLAADYARVFLAAGDATGKAALPYESVYVGSDSPLGGSTQMQLKALYSAKGLEMREDMFKIVEDHIGLEFNFMAELLSAQAEAIKDEDADATATLLKEQIDFFRNHLMKWTGMFTNDVYKYADRDFYKGFSMITSGFLGFEEAVLKDKEVGQE